MRQEIFRVTENIVAIQQKYRVVRDIVQDMDVPDFLWESVRKVITEANPDVVIHCAAWTAVDLAEDDDKKEKVHCFPLF